MRTFSLSNRVGLCLAVAVACCSLTGCAGNNMFGETVSWQGGTLVNRDTDTKEEPALPMALTLRTNGTGYAENIPQGREITIDDSICMEVTSEDLYSGNVTWKKENFGRIKISFADSEYSLGGKPDKFATNWIEARIYNCNLGPEYWLLEGFEDRVIRR